MKVDKSQLNENRRHLQKLVDSQRNEIASRQAEVKNVKSYYNEKVDQEKLYNEKRLLEVQDQNKTKLVEATNHQEEKLNNLKKNLQETQQQLEKQKENLSIQHQAEIKNINEGHSLKAKNIFDRSAEEMQDINFSVNNQIKKSKLNTEQAVQQITHKNRIKLDKAAFDAGMKASAAQNGQAQAMRDTETRYKLMMKKNESEHKNRVSEELFKNQMEFKTRQRIFQDKNDAMEKHYQNLLIGEKNTFERKYASAVQQHQSMLNDLEQKLNDQMKESIKAHSEKKEIIEFKAEDPFYSLQTMENQIREDEKFYYLDIPTPEHEKDNYVVTAHKRKIKIRFSRSSEERLDGEAGSVQESRRSESLTKEFKVDQILDSKKIKTAYNDGILTLKIAKA